MGLLYEGVSLLLILRIILKIALPVNGMPKSLHVRVLGNVVDIEALFFTFARLEFHSTGETH